MPARSTVASEFRYSPPPLDARTLVVAVTQSGETADTIAAARLAGDRGALVVAVTNTVGSAITRESHASVFLQAGPEVAVAATKTFVTQVATLVMLAADVAHQLGRLLRGEGTGARGGAAPPARPGRAGDRAGGVHRGDRRPATRTRRASCTSAAHSATRRLSRGRSRSRRSATSTPRATPRANSSTGRSPSSTPRCRSLPSPPGPRCTTRSSAI